MTSRIGRIYSGASPDAVRRDLQPLLDFQAGGLPLAEVSRLIDAHLLPHLMQYDRAGFQSMYNRIPEAGAALGAQVALAHNQGVTNWQVSPGGAMLEEVCCERLCHLFGLSGDADATFMYSGTYANQEALYLALHKRAELEGFNLGERGIAGFRNPNRLAILTSPDAHFSIDQSVRMLGLGEQSLIPADVDAHRRIDPAALRRTLDELNTTRDVVCIIATAGTTSTGSIDPIGPLVDIAHQHDAWLHVDGAYGLSFGLVPELRPRFDGIADADSITWDPHKQLGVPIPNSVLFLNRKEDFGRMALHSDYFNRESSSEPNPGLKSPPSTRPMSALALATSLLHQGLDDVADALRSPLDAITQLWEHLLDQDDFEPWHTPETGVLCFQHQPDHVADEDRNELQTFIYESILREGRRSISITRLEDAMVLRVLVMSSTTTLADLLDTVADIRAFGRSFPTEARPRKDDT